MAKNPNVYIIAGPNGAGKTTFAKRYLPIYAKCKHFVNADLIAQGLAPFGPEKVAMKAGRILLEQVYSMAESKVDFAFESTLSGKTYIPFLKQLKARGYTIHLFFLWVPSVNLSLSRIKERVKQGGHNIPVRDVRRRFRKSLKNFLSDYRPLVDYWQIVDNSSIKPRLIAAGNHGIMQVLDETLFALVTKEGRNEEN